jgi:hypothetical protein
MTSLACFPEITQQTCPSEPDAAVAATPAGPAGMHPISDASTDAAPDATAARCPRLRVAPVSACEIPDLRAGMPLQITVREGCGREPVACVASVRGDEVHLVLEGAQCAEASDTTSCLHRVITCNVPPLDAGVVYRLVLGDQDIVPIGARSLELRPMASGTRTSCAFDEALDASRVHLPFPPFSGCVADSDCALDMPPPYCNEGDCRRAPLAKVAVAGIRNYRNMVLERCELPAHPPKPAPCADDVEPFCNAGRCDVRELAQ